MKKCIIIVIMVCFIGCILNGCMSSGNKAIADPELRAKIIEGTTTQQEIIDMYGKPQTKSVMPNNQMLWQYQYILGTPIGGKGSSIGIVFDSNGVVKQISHEHDNTMGLIK